MPLFRACLFGSLIIVGLNACSPMQKVSGRSPNSALVSTYSITSALPFISARNSKRPFAFENYPRGFNEANVLQFGPCPDTLAPAFRRLRESPSGRAEPEIYGPGVVIVTSRN